MKKKLLYILVILLLLPSMVFAKNISLKEFNFTDGKYEGFQGVTETSDGGYVAVGMTYDYPVIVKYDKDDKIEWKKYDKTYSYAYDLDIDSEGNIYVTGYTYGDENVEYNKPVGYVSKYDKNGKLLDRVLIGEDDDCYQTTFYDLEVDDEKIVVVGHQEQAKLKATVDVDMQGEYRYNGGAVAIILDHDFVEIDSSLFDYNAIDEYFGVSLTSDGGFIAVGYTYSRNIHEDYYNSYIDANQLAIKFDKDYNKEWIYLLPVDERLNFENSCAYNHRGSYYDVVETCDGNFAIVGSFSQLTMIEAPEEKASWKKFDEMLGESYNGLDLDYDSDEYVFYESNEHFSCR